MPVLRFCLFFRDATQKANRKTGKSAHPPNADDHGPIIVQRAGPVLEGDTPDTLAARDFEAECDAYPEAIRLFAEGRLKIENGRLRIG